MKQIYKSKNRSKFSLKYHIVLVTKYRKKILKGSFDSDIKQIIFDISKFKDSLFSIIIMETDLDHIHLLIDAEPQVAPASIIRRIKQTSTVNSWKIYYNYLNNFYWVKNTLWSDGYFICTTGDASSETIKNYIDNQG